jgi:hypothetical protein
MRPGTVAILLAGGASLDSGLTSGLLKAARPPLSTAPEKRMETIRTRPCARTM